jgi:hypothetical protein
MLTEVRAHFTLLKDFARVGYYETDHQKQMFRDIKATIWGLRNKSETLIQKDLWQL